MGRREWLTVLEVGLDLLNHFIQCLAREDEVKSMTGRRRRERREGDRLEMHAYQHPSQVGRTVQLSLPAHTSPCGLCPVP